MWMSKRCRRMMAERDEANSSLRQVMDKNTELVERLKETEEQLSRACAQNHRLGAERDEALEKFEEARAMMDHASAKYRELRDRVETLAHRVEEMTGGVIGAVHGL